MRKESRDLIQSFDQSLQKWQTALKTPGYSKKCFSEVDPFEELREKVSPFEVEDSFQALVDILYKIKAETEEVDIIFFRPKKKPSNQRISNAVAEMSSSFESLVSILASITLKHASYFFRHEIKSAAIEYISTAMKFTQDLKALFVSKETKDEGVCPQPLNGTIYCYKLQSLAGMQAASENFLKLAKQDEWSVAQKYLQHDQAYFQLQMLGFHELHMEYERQIEKVYTRDRYGNVRKKRKGRFGNNPEQEKWYANLLIQKLELITAMTGSIENILPNSIKGKTIDSLLKNSQIITKKTPRDSL